MTIERDASELRRSDKPVRSGWAAAARRIAAQNDDGLVMGEFANEDDADLRWQHSTLTPGTSPTNSLDP